jgi:hypothetical protein
MHPDRARNEYASGIRMQDNNRGYLMDHSAVMDHADGWMKWMGGRMDVELVGGRRSGSSFAGRRDYQAV